MLGFDIEERASTMSSSSDRAQPHWGRPTPPGQPASRLGLKAGTDTDSVPAPESQDDALRALLLEVRDLRRNFEDRMRSVSHRLDGIDTDLLRLVTLVRKGDGVPPNRTQDFAG
jgi:hypothetical protein